MVQKRTLGRGVAVLAALALVAGALIVSPVGAAAPVTKKKVRKIATKVFNKKIGPATAPFEAKSSDIVVFQKDGKGTGTLADPQQINSLSITAPAAGFLVISGQVTIDNDQVAFANHDICLRPKVDGANVVTGAGTSIDETLAEGQAICGEAFGQADDDQTSLAYTVVASVGAGAHTVSQEIFNAGTEYDYFNAGLTAQFYHTGSISTGPVLRTGRSGGPSEE
jgi:hypothetical protein